MPRKYRPPASSKRRKAKTVDYNFPTPEETGAETAVAEEDADYAEDEDTDTEEATVQSRSRSARTIGERPERHVRHDYSYVRNEVLRIVLIGGVLVIGLIIAGFFR